MKAKVLSLTIAVIVAIAGLSSPNTANASGIPVIDAANMTQNLMNHVEDVAKFVEQIEQLKAQLTQMQQQYDALTGTRNLGDILNNPAFKDYLPADWQNVYKSLQNGGYSGLTGTAAAIRNANRLFDTCAAKQGEAKTLCERAASKAAQDKAFADEAFDSARSRWDQIEALMRKVNETHDPKGIAELQARITAETAAIQNEQVKMNLYAMAAEAEDRLIQQQQKEAADRTWNAKGTGGVTAEPLTF